MCVLQHPPQTFHRVKTMRPSLKAQTYRLERGVNIHSMINGDKILTFLQGQKHQLFLQSHMRSLGLYLYRFMNSFRGISDLAL